MMTPISNEMPAPGLRAHFVPRWPGNPYHAELAEQLRPCGIDVGDEWRLKPIVRRCHVSGRSPDLVHIHAVPRFELSPLQFLRFGMFFHRLRWLRRRGVGVVWTIHDSFHHEAVFPRIDMMFSRAFFYQADAVIVHSEAARKAVERQWDVRRDAGVFVIPHGNFIGSYPNTVSREEARGKLRIPVGKMVVLFLGMIRPYKGVRNLVRSFKEMSADDMCLVIAGMPMSEELSAGIASEVESRPDILYRPGHVKDEEVQDYLNAADVVVFPYTKALTSGALVLAMSFGRACIAPKLGALEDTLDDEGGMLYDPSRPDGLRKAMEAARAERSRLKTMGEHNRRKAEGWPWEKVARMTAEVYQWCVAESRSGSVAAVPEIQPFHSSHAK